MDGTRECIDVAPCSGNDNDNDRSFSQLPVHKALTCREGPECLGSGPSLVGAGNSLDAKKRCSAQISAPSPWLLLLDECDCCGCFGVAVFSTVDVVMGVVIVTARLYIFRNRKTHASDE